MKLGGLFPQSKTLASVPVRHNILNNQAGQASSVTAAAPALNVQKLIERQKPGQFNVTWPKFQPQQPKDYQVITDKNKLIEYIKRCETTGLGGFDYETAGDDDHRSPQDVEDKVAFDPHRAKIVTVSISAAPHEARAVFIDNPGDNQFEPTLSRNEARTLLMDILSDFFFTNSKIIKTAVNLSFETKFTAKYGKYILMPVADPLVQWVRVMQLLMPHKIKDPKRPITGLGLKPMTKNVFGVEMTNFEDLLEKYGVSFFDELSSDNPDTISYSCEDSDYAVQHYLYWDNMAKQIPNNNPVYKNYSEWLHAIEMPFSRVIGLMEFHGMAWDSDVAEVRRQEAILTQEQTYEELQDLAKQLFGTEVNAGKNGKTKDVKELLFNKLKLPAAAYSDKTSKEKLDTNAIIDMIFMLENNLENIDEEKYLGIPLPEGWENIDPDKDPSLDSKTRGAIKIAKRPPHPYKDEGIKLLNLLRKAQKYSTLLSSHIEGREKYVNPITHRIHANYTPWTETARLNSSNPNGQNVPRPDNDELGIRNFFKAPPGKVLFLIDYSGFELRLIAWKSLDEVMLDIFINGGDMHRKTASTLTGKPPEEVTKHERSNAKAGNFGITYGGTEHALQKTFKKMEIRKSLEECAAIVRAVKDTYPKIAVFQNAAIIEAREKGYAETIYGYKRMLPNINSTISGLRNEDGRRAGNTPIQGSAADVMKKSQNQVYDRIGNDTYEASLLNRYGWNDEATVGIEVPPIMVHGSVDMIAQIHDEIIFEMNDDADLVEAAAKIIKTIMEQPPLPNFPVPIEAEASVAYSWGNKSSLDNWVDIKRGTLENGNKKL